MLLFFIYCSTYRDFYNIISQLTDFEGSAHNGTGLPNKIQKALKNENTGYFPYPVKWVEDKWIINYDKGDIPLGSEIVSINDEGIDDIVQGLHKYYTTDGVNVTGKRIGVWVSFSMYYRYANGLKSSFEVVYKSPDSDTQETVVLASIGY